MTDEPRSAPDEPLPTAQVGRRATISIVWIVPIVAAIAAGWVLWTTWAQQGPKVRVTFATAAGLESGKTKVRYKDIDVGRVESVVIAPDLARVVATIAMDREAEALLSDTTTFWVVTPRVGASGVSGLETLLSGAYVGIDRGAGQPSGKREFEGLPDPPLISSDRPGTKFQLIAEQLGSVQRGSPIYHRGFVVGQVQGVQLLLESGRTHLFAFIDAPFDELVRVGTRFWDAGGIRVSLGGGGPAIEVPPLQALLLGGIEFETPAAARSAPRAPPDALFALYADREAMRTASIRQRVPYLARFAGSARGLSPGSMVTLLGMRVGSVVDVGLEPDRDTGSFRIAVSMDLEPERFKIAPGSEGAVAATAEESYVNAAQLVARGLRAQLRSTNLLTGEQHVALDFFPAAPAADLDMSGPVPVIPTVPSGLDTLERSLTQILDKLAGLPLEQLVVEFTAAAGSLRELAGSPELTRALASAAAASDDLRRLAAVLSTEAGPLARALREDAQKLGQALDGINAVVSARGGVRADLDQLLKEFTAAGRSVRILADYLARHPDAVLRGRTGN